jgi:hypothetical protein
MIRNFALLVVLICTDICLAYPSRIIVFRHAEKPSHGDHLSEKGRKRAKKLVNYLTTDPAMTLKGLPSAIFAAGIKDEGSSWRSIETVSPLSRFLDVPVNADFLKDEVDDLEEFVSNKKSLNNKVIVICWQHAWIPPLAEQFGLDYGPDEWEDKDFDTIWILDFKSANRLAGFQVVHPRLMD